MANIPTNQHKYLVYKKQINMSSACRGTKHYNAMWPSPGWVKWRGWGLSSSFSFYLQYNIVLDDGYLNSHSAMILNECIQYILGFFLYVRIYFRSIKR